DCNYLPTYALSLLLFCLYCFLEFLRLLLGDFFRDAVVLLELSNELLAIAVDDIEVVVGDLAPSRLGFALILFPLPFQLVPVHLQPPFRSISTCRRRRMPCRRRGKQPPHANNRRHHREARRNTG